MGIHQRGIIERHGKTFKFMLMKAMDTYSCQNVDEWEALVDVTTIMTKNRMLQTNGYSPIQRVYSVSHLGCQEDYYPVTMEIDKTNDGTTGRSFH